MPAKPTTGGIHVEGDVSGTIVYGDGNRITTTHHAGVSMPGEGRPPHEQNLQDISATDNGNVYAVTQGTMHVTVNRHDRHDDGQDGQDSQDNEEC